MQLDLYNQQEYKVLSLVMHMAADFHSKSTVEQNESRCSS